MFAIVGLGNPGRRYEGTRHNVGFRVVERLNQQFGAGRWDDKGNCLTRRVQISGEDSLLILPQGYMNRSGEVASPQLRFFKITPDQVVVIYDELDLPPGRVRIKRGGGGAGHRGIEDMVQHLGSGDFYRIRVGIGHPRDVAGIDASGDGVANWVLSKPRGEDQELITRGEETATEAIPVLITKGLTEAQQLFNS